MKEIIKDLAGDIDYRYNGFTGSYIAEENPELSKLVEYDIKNMLNNVLKGLLKIVQEDVDFGAKQQQIVSTKAQSKILELLAQIDLPTFNE